MTYEDEFVDNKHRLSKTINKIETDICQLLFWSSPKDNVADIKGIFYR